MDHQRMIDHEMSDLNNMLLKMGKIVQGLIVNSVHSLKGQDVAAAKKVIAEDEQVDQLELDIDEKCVQLIALRQPEASDLRFVLTGMRITTDLERIGDLAEDIAQRTLELAGQPLPKPIEDIPKMAKLAEEALAIVLEAFVKRDARKARQVWDKEKNVDKLRDAVCQELVAIMSKDSSTVKQSIPLLLVARHLERISDHVTNIAEDIIYMVEGKVVKHAAYEDKL